MFKFPSIYRRFTDVRFWREKQVIVVLTMILFFLIFVVVGFDLLGNVSKKIVLDKKRQEIIEQINYWKGITAKYKDYRDGYFELAVLEYQLNDREKAQTYLQAALKLDPNFQKGRELEKILNNKN